MVGGVMAILVNSTNYSARSSKTATFAPIMTTASNGTITTTYQAQGVCNGGETLNIGTPVATLPTTATPYYCAEGTQTGNVQVAGMAGIEWFIKPRDYFPYKRGTGTRGANWVPSPLFASSITSLGSVFVGPNFEPVNGFNFFLGMASAHKQSLSTAMLKEVYLPVGSSGAAPTFSPITQTKWGFSFGVGFDLSVFLQLFSKASGPSLP